jgi:Zn-dependent protease with chaperone function
MMFVDPQGYANAHAFGWLQRWGFASITTGQLKENSDGETLAVMAHEFGHLKHRDTLRNDFTTPLSVITGLIPAGIMAAMTFRSLKRNRRINPAQYIGFRIGAGASLVLWPVIFYLMQKYFSRRRERFADRVSAQHFDPRYGKRFFEKILKKCGRDKRFLAWLRRTHPFKEERIKFFESQIPVWDARQEKEKAAAAAAA